MSRLCGGDGCVEWVSKVGEDEWYNKHGRLNESNTTKAKGVMTYYIYGGSNDGVHSVIILQRVL